MYNSKQKLFSLDPCGIFKFLVTFQTANLLNHICQYSLNLKSYVYIHMWTHIYVCTIYVVIAQIKKIIHACIYTYICVFSNALGVKSMQISCLLKHIQILRCVKMFGSDNSQTSFLKYLQVLGTLSFKSSQSLQIFMHLRCVWGKKF